MTPTEHPFDPGGNPWVQTASGKKIDLIEPDPKQITLHDIAVQLARTARYSGATLRFYSVAEHSVLVSEHLEAEGHDLETQMHGLLHDAHEAFIGDMTTPVQLALGADFKLKLAKLKIRLDGAIATALAPHLLPPDVAAIHAADMAVLMAERRDLLAEPPASWGPRLESVSPSVHVRPQGVAPLIASKVFMHRFRDLHDWLDARAGRGAAE